MDEFERLIEPNLEAALASIQTVRDWAGADEAAGDLWIECDAGVFRVEAVTSKNAAVMYVAKASIEPQTIYVFCGMDGSKPIGWIFGSTLFARTGGSVSLSKDDIRMAFSTRMLRSMRDLEKVMIGPAEAPHGKA